MHPIDGLLAGMPVVIVRKVLHQRIPFATQAAPPRTFPTISKVSISSCWLVIAVCGRGKILTDVEDFVERQRHSTNAMSHQCHLNSLTTVLLLLPWTRVPPPLSTE
jgi:hypothetical protein